MKGAVLFITFATLWMSMLVACGKKGDPLCPPNQSRITMTVFGDSNNDYAAYLRKFLNSKQFNTLTSRGYSGYTFERARSVIAGNIDTLYNPNKRNIILVMFGTNDLKLNIPLDSVTDQATALFRTLKDSRLYHYCDTSGKATICKEV
jgi:lysophospholipase L1-like esterase